jgi:hypothetical protein
MTTSHTRFSSWGILAASALATAATTLGPAVPAHADPRVFTAKVTVDNQTSQKFDVVWQEVTDGEFVTYANDELPAHSSDWLRTTANVDQGGTSGGIKYKTENGGNVVIYWNNPYEEDNVYSCHVPDGMECSWDDNGLYETEVTFTITPE